MKDFFKNNFEYQHHFNQKLANQLMENKERLSKRSIPLFSHCINAHHIWNNRILCNEILFGVNQLHLLGHCKTFDDENLHTTLTIIDEYDIESIFGYSNSKGIQFKSSIIDTLFHVSNHHSHHRAMIISDLRQNGIEPIKTDYIFYRR